MPTMALDGRRQFDRSYEEILALPSLSIYIYPLKACERILFLDENRFRAAVFDSFEFPSKYKKTTTDNILPISLSSNKSHPFESMIEKQGN